MMPSVLATLLVSSALLGQLPKDPTKTPDTIQALIDQGVKIKLQEMLPEIREKEREKLLKEMKDREDERRKLIDDLTKECQAKVAALQKEVDTIKADRDKLQMADLVRKITDQEATKCIEREKAYAKELEKLRTELAAVEAVELRRKLMDEIKAIQDKRDKEFQEQVAKFQLEMKAKEVQEKVQQDMVKILAEEREKKFQAQLDMERMKAQGDSKDKIAALEKRLAEVSAKEAADAKVYELQLKNLELEHAQALATLEKRTDRFVTILAPDATFRVAGKLTTDTGKGGCVVDYGNGKSQHLLVGDGFRAGSADYIVDAVFRNGVRFTVTQRLIIDSQNDGSIKVGNSPPGK